MPEQDLNPTSAKFISSLVKSLQILCNGHVDFHESIELIGHINVRVDRKYKFDYIVDEHVSKEGEDSATTFLSNSYHSCPPLRQPRKRSSSVELDQDVMFSDLSQSINGKSSQSKAVQDSLSRSHDFCSEDTLVREEESSANFSVTVGSPNRRGSQTDQIVIKLEGDDDSNDCMVLPASPGDYDPVGEVSVEGFQAVDASVSFEESDGNQVSCIRKRRQPNEPGAVDGSSSSKGRVEGGEKSTAGKRGASELIGRFAAYECLYCSVILTEREDLGLHNKSCPSPSCCMICLTCGEKFPSNPDMRQHLKFVHNQKTFGCKFCDMMFLSSSGLLSHTKAKHKPDAKTMCQICGQAFHNKANLEGHMNMHLGLRPFICKKCGKTYGHSKSLMTHEKTCSKPVSPRGIKSLSSKQLSQMNTEIMSSRKASSSANLDLAEGKRPSGTARNLGASNTCSFHEPYQPFCESKGLCNAESSLKNESNAGQQFPYNNYQSLQTVNLTDISDSSIVDNKPRDAVYSQASADFAMSQVNYGIFSSGTLPAHR